jgi:hypothetical protein
MRTTPLWESSWKSARKEAIKGKRFQHDVDEGVEYKRAYEQASDQAVEALTNLDVVVVSELAAQVGVRQGIGQTGQHLAVVVASHVAVLHRRHPRLTLGHDQPQPNRSALVLQTQAFHLRAAGVGSFCPSCAG